MTETSNPNLLVGRPGKDITGQRFGKLLVLRGSPEPRHWICKCDCGVQKSMTKISLTSGRAQSCGCGHQTPKYKRRGAILSPLQS